MNTMHNILIAGMDKAESVLHFLDDAGATAIDINVRGGRPVITLDGEPPRFIRGVLYKSRPVDAMHREHVMVAMVQGCRVEWVVRTLRGAAARERA